METIFSLTMRLGDVVAVVAESNSGGGGHIGCSTSTLVFSVNVEIISSTFSAAFVITSTCLFSSSVMIGIGVGGFVIVA